MPTDDPLARARTLTNLLDNAVRVPGTSMRFGLDPVLGLVPGLGDVAGAALSGYVVLLASQLGAPTTVIVRMLGNVVIDTVGGTFPVIGDLFDAGWKSNSRNLALLERHLGQTRVDETREPRRRAADGRGSCCCWRSDRSWSRYFWSGRYFRRSPELRTEVPRTWYRVPGPAFAPLQCTEAPRCMDGSDLAWPVRRSSYQVPVPRTSVVVQAVREFMSITNRYFTSLFSIRS